MLAFASMLIAPISMPKKSATADAPASFEEAMEELTRLVAQMEAVNTDGVEPLAHPAAILGDVALRLRDDIADEPNQRDISQRSAPAVGRGLFLVPKVIE